MICYKSVAGAALMMLMAQGCAAQTCPAPETTLDAAVSRTQQALRSGDTQAFLSLIGPDGLTLGQEAPALSKAALTAELKGRQGAYCDLFTCAGRKGYLNRLVASGGAAKVISKARTGDVFAVVTIHKGHATDETELHFAYVDCRWQLMAIGTL